MQKVKRKEILRLKLSDEEIQRLPLVTKARRIYFYRRRCSRLQKGHLYIKYGEFFSTNLFTLLEELKRGDLSKIWYSYGTGALIELTRTRSGSLTGHLITKYKPMMDSFKERLKRK